MFSCSKFNDIIKQFEENINSHSFIFYTNDFDMCKNDVIELVKKIYNVDNLSNVESDFLVVSSQDRKNILKNDTEQIKSFFQNKSYLNKYRIYLIEEAHKLNSSASNMILKFLEEPLEGIVGLFITTNLDSVIGTIKSRCQIINCFYDINNVDDNLSFDLVENLFICDVPDTICFIKKKYKDVERNDLLNIFNNYLNFCYNSAIKNEMLYLRIKILNKAITMLNNNVNIDYVLDYILLKGR